jgi:hypothetical protein
MAKSDYWLRHIPPSVCLVLHIEQLDSHWADIQEILHFIIFRKSVEKIKVSLKRDNALHEDLCIPVIYLAEFFSE